MGTLVVPAHDNVSNGRSPKQPAPWIVTAGTSWRAAVLSDVPVGTRNGRVEGVSCKEECLEGERAPYEASLARVWQTCDDRVFRANRLVTVCSSRESA